MTDEPPKFSTSETYRTELHKFLDQHIEKPKYEEIGFTRTLVRIRIMTIINDRRRHLSQGRDYSKEDGRGIANKRRAKGKENTPNQTNEPREISQPVEFHKTQLLPKHTASHTHSKTAHPHKSSNLNLKPVSQPENNIAPPNKHTQKNSLVVQQDKTIETPGKKQKNSFFEQKQQDNTEASGQKKNTKKKVLVQDTQPETQDSYDDGRSNVVVEDSEALSDYGYTKRVCNKFRMEDMTRLDAIILLKAFYSLSRTEKLTKEILDDACLCFKLKESTSILSLAKEFIVRKHVEIRGGLPVKEIR